MKKFLLKSAIALLCVYMSVGCASIVHGTTQDIQISSSPDNAEIWIDGANYGKTPSRVTLKRQSSYLITLKKEGHKESTIKIEGKVSSWIIGNIIFGGIIGCGIDFISGGAYDLYPELLSINLSKLAALDGQSIEIPTERMSRLQEIRLTDDSGNIKLAVTIK